MELIVITAEGDVEKEVETIKELFDAGLDRLHIRKPNWGEKEIEALLKRIGKKHYKYISLHGHPELAKKLKLSGINLNCTEPVPERGKWHGRISRSCHDLKEVEGCFKGEIDYIFISPVFDSISKPGYFSAFDENELRTFLKKKRRCKVIGLGGIHSERIPLLNDMGFDGAAVLGSIWEIKSVNERLEMFKQLKDRCQRVDQM